MPTDKPLSRHAICALRVLSHGQVPRNTFNPGVVDRLTRGTLAELVQGIHRGREVQHLRITSAGRAALAQAGHTGEQK
jgi:hypothetical protein